MLRSVTLIHLIFVTLLMLRDMKTHFSHLFGIFKSICVSASEMGATEACDLESLNPPPQPLAGRLLPLGMNMEAFRRIKHQRLLLFPPALQAFHLFTEAGITAFISIQRLIFRVGGSVRIHNCFGSREA